MRSRRQAFSSIRLPTSSTINLLTRRSSFIPIQTSITSSRMNSRITRTFSTISTSRNPSLSICFQLPKVISSFLQSPSSIPQPLSLAYPSNSLSTSQSISSQTESDSWLNWDGILNAVPKKKVSHSRKSMRSANKGLKNKSSE